MTTPCKCNQFWTESTKPCRFATHPDPALCGREDRAPAAPEKWTWPLEWYGALAGDDRDSGDEA